MIRERERRLDEERRDVRALNEWRPATPLGTKAGTGQGGGSIVSGVGGTGTGGPPGTSMGTATATGTVGSGSVLSGMHTASIISGGPLAHGSAPGGGGGTALPPALSTIGSTPAFQD